MPCSCQKAKTQFAVVTNDGNGRQVYASSDVNLAKKVAVRYPGSVVKDKDGVIVHRQTAPAASTGTGKPNETAE